MEIARPHIQSSREKQIERDLSLVLQEPSKSSMACAWLCGEKTV
jgi:hypothetical protein